jgi:hypothetical protein
VCVSVSMCGVCVCVSMCGVCVCVSMCGVCVCVSMCGVCVSVYVGKCGRNNAYKPVQQQNGKNGMQKLTCRDPLESRGSSI